MERFTQVHLSLLGCACSPPRGMLFIGSRWRCFPGSASLPGLWRRQYWSELYLIEPAEPRHPGDFFSPVLCDSAQCPTGLLDPEFPSIVNRVRNLFLFATCNLAIA